MATVQFDPIGKFKYTKDDMGNYHSYNDEPAIDYIDGSCKIWYKNGVIHRENLPSFITKYFDKLNFEFSNWHQFENSKIMSFFEFARKSFRI